jgi:hypothetical protein
MSKSNKKILVSGCGISWSLQEKKTWASILQSMGINIVDVGGPAISNQSILNSAIDYLIKDSSITSVIIQLTDGLKLDVEIINDRKAELVDPDPLRNFVHQGIWPSSKSKHHPAKELWHKWLASPSLEIQDIFCKLILLNHWCHSKNIQLIVTQGYDIPWNAQQLEYVKPIVSNLDLSIYDWYQSSDYYRLHDPSDTVLCIEFQIELASYFSKQLGLDLSEKLERLKSYQSSK